MSTAINVSRRDFMALSGGLVLGFVLPARSLFGQENPYRPANIIAPPPPGNPNAYIRIGTDDSVTFLIAKSEMGQGPATACSQLLAEELECDWAKVKMQFAPVDPRVYGYQTTVGSLAIRTAWEPMRRAGAEAREMLIRAAAARWNVSPSQCRAENGVVINTATGARLNYGAIAEEASKLPVPTDIVLKKPKDFKIIGKPLKRLDTREKITGTAMYGIDVVLPGMLHAVVDHCPVFGGKVASFDATKARAVPGVKDVFEIPTGVVVVADTTWAAMQGRRALVVKYDEGEGATLSSTGIRQLFVECAAKPGAAARKEGDAEQALASATGKTLQAAYDVQFLAHAPMEPMNCTIHYRGDHAEAWLSSQSPTSATMFIAETLGLTPEQVLLHRTYVGGGFGRRGEEQQNYLVEAAQIAKRFNVPVKMTWTREDDLSLDYYRPAAYAEMSGALDATGWPSSLRVKVVSPPLGALRDGLNGTAVSGLSDLLYELPHLLVTYHPAALIIPVRYWRAPGPSQNTFAAEGFFDELCVAGGKDPVEARRRLLTKHPRLLHVLNVAAEKAGWGKPLPPGHFHGVAVASNIGFNAQVAEVSVTDGRVQVHRIVCAFDCGIVVNPAILKQQIESGVLWGVSAALKEEITIEKGRVQQVNFNKYDPIRTHEVPVVEIHIVENTESPLGSGEATVPNAVPAVANAIFAATGKRLRRVPIRPADLA